MGQEPVNRQRNAIRRLLGWMLVGLGLVAVSNTRLITFRLLPPCLFRTWTGWLCPGCGMTRAVIQWMQGHWAQAIRYNPLILLLVGFVFYCAAKEGSAAVGGPRWSLSPGWRLGLFWSVLGLALLFGVVRNIPVFPWTMLAPP